MPVRIILLFSLLLGAFLATHHFRSTPSPDLEFPARIDLGVLVPTREVAIQVELVNHLDRVQRIAALRTSCGCLGAFKQTPAGEMELAEVETIPAGGVLRLVVRLQVPATGEERISQTIEFERQLPQAKTETIEIAGSISRLVVAQPSSIQETIERDNSFTQTITLFDRREPGKQTPIKLDADIPAFRIGELNAATSFAANASTFQLTIAGVGSEPIRGNIRVLDANDRILCVIPVDVQPKVESPFAPSRIELSAANQTQPVRVLLKHPTIQKVELEGVPEWLRCEVQNRTATLSIIDRAGFLKAPIQLELTFTIIDAANIKHHAVLPITLLKPQ